MNISSPYRRVVLKITGEALGGGGTLFDPAKVEYLVEEICSVRGISQIAIVIGGGNIIRGSALKASLGTTGAVADYIGMTATIMNAMLLEDCLKRRGAEAVAVTSIPANALAEPYLFKKVIHHLERGRIVILAAGTGNAGVTTDTGAILRAGDLQADIVLKGTKVDGVYDKDPKAFRDAKLLQKLSYQDFLVKNLSKILDESAVAQAKMKGMPIKVFDLFKPGNLRALLTGQDIGSTIS